MATLSSAEIQAARKQGRDRAAHEPHAVSASYDAKHDRVNVELTTGVILGLPRAKLQGLANATPAQLKRVMVLGPGTAIAWDEPNVGFTVSGLAQGLLGSKAWMSQLGRLGGSAKSERKTATSRENGKKGGRPKSPAAVQRSEKRVNEWAASGTLQKIPKGKLTGLIAKGVMHEKITSTTTARSMAKKSTARRAAGGRKKSRR